MKKMKKTRTATAKKTKLTSSVDQAHHLKRLNKIIGQIQGIKKMLEEQRYCMDILIQTKAASSAIKSLETSILEDHLNQCVQSAFKAKNSKESAQKIEELLLAFRKGSMN